MKLKGIKPLFRPFLSISLPFGPSKPGTINLVSGNTHGAYPINQLNDEGKRWGVVNGTVIGDLAKLTIVREKRQMNGQNVGDLQLY